MLAEGCYWLAQATLESAQEGGIPPEEKQKAGERAIALARQALELHIQLHGTENVRVANSMTIIADVLCFFNNVDDDEILRLHERANSITSRLEGAASANVVVGENNLGLAYQSRAERAEDANDVDRCMANFELTLIHFHKAAKILRAINHVESADDALSAHRYS